MKTSVQIYLILSLVMLGACEWSGYEEEPEAAELENAANQKWEDNSNARFNAIGDEAGNMLKSDLAWWAYQENVTWLKGINYRDNDELRIDVYKADSYIDIIIKVDLSSIDTFPEVYNTSFHKKEIANVLEMTLIFEDKESGKVMKMGGTQPLSSKGKANFNYQLNTADMQSMKAGKHNFSLSLNTELVSFFKVRSKVHPLSATANLPYIVPPIYETTIYFKKLKLNEEKTKKLLGSNDWQNPAPETGILVSINGQTVLYGHAKNKFEYNEIMKVSAYHCSPNDNLLIKTLDVDYGFNANDVISDTLIPIKALEGTDYYNVKMKYVDELLIYTKFKGRKNK